MQPLSLVIPSLNEEHYLPRLLESIAKQKYEALFEVVLVDGGSTDRTLDRAREYTSRIRSLHIYTTGKGVSHQRNYGAAKAKYNNLVFLDADTQLPSPDTLTGIGATFNGPGDFVGIPLLFPYDGKLIDYILGAQSYIYFLLVRHRAPVTPGMCIITTKSNHERIHGFNEKVVFGEDIDYGLRSVRSGARYRVFLRILLGHQLEGLMTLGGYDWVLSGCADTRKPLSTALSPLRTVVPTNLVIGLADVNLSQAGRQLTPLQATDRP